MDFMFNISLTDVEVEVMKTCLVECLEDETAFNIYKKLCDIYCSEDDKNLINNHGE